MDLLKRMKQFVCVDNGLFAGVVLCLIAAFSWTRFVDWSGPADELTDVQREHAADCIRASRSLGDDIDRVRPDCRDVLSPRSAAMTVEHRPSVQECTPHVIDKPGGDDGLDSCGYPGMPKCLSTPPPGCP